MKLLFFIVFSLNILFVSGQDLSNINVLKFQTTNEYITFLESNSLQGLSAINGYQNFVSLKTTFVNEPIAPPEIDQNLPDDDYDIKEDILPLYDPKNYASTSILCEILNVDKIVVIGNWFIKIDLEKEKAFLLKTTFSNQYADLVIGNPTNVNILEYSLNEDGVDILDQLDGVSENNASRCKLRTAVHKSDEKTLYNGNRRRVNMMVAYQNFFIYHHLKVHAKIQKRFLRVWWTYGGRIAFGNLDLEWKTKNCKSSCSFHGIPSIAVCGNGVAQQNGILHIGPYNQARRLANYTLKLDVISENGNGHVEIEDN